MEDSLVSMTLKTYLYMFEIVISYKELLKLQWIFVNISLIIIGILL